MLRPQVQGDRGRPIRVPWPPCPMILPILAVLAALTGCSGPWQPPVEGPVTRPFQPPGHAFGAGHRGVDLLALPGDPVRSPTAGTVLVAAAIAGRPVLVVRDAAGRRATLEPVLALVPVGTEVEAGALVGRVARGGHCDGRCLHLGVRVDAPGEPPAYLPAPPLMACRPILLPDA